MQLQQIRQKIDIIDTQIVQLIHERLTWALCTTPHKKDPEDPERERRIVERLSRSCGLIIPDQALAGIYREIFLLSRDIQQQPTPTLVALGGQGGPGEEAGRRGFADHKLVTIPQAADFLRVLCTIPDTEGLAALDNLSGKALDQLWQSLRQQTLSILGVLRVPSPPAALMIPPGSDHRTLREVWTTPGNLAAHQTLFERLRLHPRLFVCEGLAARKLLGTGSRHIALAGSTVCAERFGLEILRELPSGGEDAGLLFLLLGAHRQENTMDPVLRLVRSHQAPSQDRRVWHRQFPALQLCLAGDPTQETQDDTLTFRSVLRSLES
jgi:chorismate mutase